MSTIPGDTTPPATPEEARAERDPLDDKLLAEAQPRTDSSPGPRTPLPWTPATILHLALADDVEFAVRAVNNHAKLLAVLKRVLTTTLEIDRTLGHGHFNPGTLQKMADVIEEAQS